MDELRERQPEQQSAQTNDNRPVDRLGPDDPILNLPAPEVQRLWKRGDLDDNRAKDYISLKLMEKRGGYLELPEQHAKRLYERGYVNADKAREWAEYQKAGSPKATLSAEARKKGEAVLNMLAIGMSRDEALRELGGIEHPAALLDPVNIVTDIGTGAFIAKKVGGSALKIITKEVGIGTAASAGFDLSAHYFKDSTTMQILGGLLGPLAATTMVSLSREGFKRIFNQISDSNPDIAKAIRDVTKASPDDDVSKIIRSHLDEPEARIELEEAELGATRGFDEPAPDLPKAKTAGDDYREGPESRYSKDEARDKSIFDATKIRHIRRSHDGEIADRIDIKFDSEILKKIEARNGDPAKIIGDIDNFAKDLIRAERKLGTSDVEVDRTADKLFKRVAAMTGRDETQAKAAMRFVSGVREDMRHAAAKAKAVDEFFTAYSKQVDEIIKKAKTFDDELRALEHINMLSEMQAMMYGIRAEFGRGLRIYGTGLKRRRFDFEAMGKDELDVLRRDQGDRIRDVLDSYRNAKDPIEKMTRARAVGSNRTLRGILEFQQAMLLSSPTSQAVNIIGNTMTLANETFHRTVGVSYDAWKRAGGISSPLSRDMDRMAEMHYYKEGMKKAWIDLFRVKDGWRGLSIKTIRDEESGAFWRALWTGKPQIDVTNKVEMQNTSILKGDNPKGMRYKIGTLLTLPFHGLTAGDEVFKRLNYMASLYANTARDLIRTGTRGADLDKAMTNNLRNITPEAHHLALKQARVATFTNPLGKFGEGIEKLTMNNPIGLSSRILAMPFFKIIANLTKYGMRHTVLGATPTPGSIGRAIKKQDIGELKMVSKQLDELWKSGDAAKRSEVVSRVLTGTSLMLAGAYMYEKGVLTGRVDPGLRDTAKAAGYQEYSIRLGKTLTSLNRLDPLVMPLFVGADLALAVDSASQFMEDMENPNVIDKPGVMEDLISPFILAFVSPILDKTTAKSAKDMVDLYGNVSRGTANWDKEFTQQISKYLPRLLDFGNEAMENEAHLREAWQPIDAFYKKVMPWKLPKKRHAIYGTPMESMTRVGMMLTRDKLTDDPALLEILKLGMEIHPMPKTLSVLGLGTHELNLNEYDKMLSFIDGEGLKNHLQKLVNNPKYDQIPDNDDKKQEISNIIRAYREQARKRFLSETEEGRAIIEKQKQKYILKKTGKTNKEKSFPLLDRLKEE